MQNHNFILGPVDTDSISFCKPNFEAFSKEEQDNLLNEINSYFPELIKYDHDGYFRTCISLKAKNYILQDFEGKITYKGSALKSSKLEPALKQFLHDIIDTILTEKYEYVIIYNNYVKEILNITDIKRWATKRSLTEKVLNGTRTNETKVMYAIKDSEYKEGDKLFVYYDQELNLKLIENYNNDYNVTKLLKRLFDTSKVFNNILPKDTFINYSLKNKKIKQLLEELK